MKDAKDFDVVTTQSIWHHIRRLANHKFSRTGTTAWTASLRQAEKRSNACHDQMYLIFGCGRVVEFDMGSRLREVA